MGSPWHKQNPSHPAPEKPSLQSPSKHQFCAPQLPSEHHFCAKWCACLVRVPERPGCVVLGWPPQLAGMPQVLGQTEASWPHKTIQFSQPPPIPKQGTPSDPHTPLSRGFAWDQRVSLCSLVSVQCLHPFSTGCSCPARLGLSPAARPWCPWPCAPPQTVLFGM